MFTHSICRNDCARNTTLCKQLTFNLVNVNDEPPVFLGSLEDPTPMDIQLKEEQDNATLLTILADDLEFGDDPEFRNDLTLDLTGGSNYFNLTKTGSGAWDLGVFGLDYDLGRSEYRLQLVLSDSMDPFNRSQSAERSLVVQVVDLPDTAPMWTHPCIYESFDEELPPEYPFMKIKGPFKFIFNARFCAQIMEF